VPYPMEMIDRSTGKVVGTQIQMIKSDLDEQLLVDIAQSTEAVFQGPERRKIKGNLR